MKLKIYLCLLTFMMCVNSIFSQETIVTQPTSAARTKLKELPRFELGAQFTSLNDNPGRVSFGSRLTFNLNRSVALEAEGNFFPSKFFDGRSAQGLFGIKAGKRYDKFGIFAKARPGFIYRSKGKFELSGTSQNPIYKISGRTDAAIDVGGVVEFYLTKRIFTRFDAGDTITRSGRVNAFYYDQNGNIQSIRISARTLHNFQLSAGIGFRF